MVSRLVLGTAQLETGYGIANRRGPAGAAQGIDILKAAVNGFVAVDTAPTYGRAEELIGDAGIDLPVFTKLKTGVNPEESVRHSLRRLKRRWIDLLFVHDPSVVLHDPEHILARAHALVGDRIGGLGVSTYTPEEFSAALEDERITAIQAPINVADRRLLLSGLLRRAAGSGRRVYVRSPFLQGSLLMDAKDLPTHLRILGPLLKECDQLSSGMRISRMELLLGFTNAIPGVAGVVVGAETVDQTKMLIQAGRVDVDIDKVLDAVATQALPSVDVIDPRRWPS